MEVHCFTLTKVFIVVFMLLVLICKKFAVIELEKFLFSATNFYFVPFIIWEINKIVLVAFFNDLKQKQLHSFELRCRFTKKSKNIYVFVTIVDPNWAGYLHVVMKKHIQINLSRKKPNFLSKTIFSHFF